MASKREALDRGGESSSKKRSLKQQIRDTQRLLAKEELPETVRLTKERVLKSLHGELNDKATQRQKQKMAKKYRMVKFFDKRKVVRRLSKACKEFVEEGINEDERTELTDTINELRQELNYNVHFPPHEKYISLYPSSTRSSTATRKQKQLLASIVESVAEGLLPDAASLEREVLLPSQLISSHTEFKRSRKTSRGNDDHSEEAPKRKKKRKSSISDVIDAKPESKNKLQDDGFFILDSKTDS